MDQFTADIMRRIRRLEEKPKGSPQPCPPEDAALFKKALDEALVGAYNDRQADLEATDGFVHLRLD